MFRRVAVLGSVVNFGLVDGLETHFGGIRIHHSKEGQPTLWPREHATGGSNINNRYGKSRICQ